LLISVAIAARASQVLSFEKREFRFEQTGGKFLSPNQTVVESNRERERERERKPKPKRERRAAGAAVLLSVAKFTKNTHTAQWLHFAF